MIQKVWVIGSLALTTAAKVCNCRSFCRLPTHRHNAGLKRNSCPKTPSLSVPVRCCNMLYLQFLMHDTVGPRLLPFSSTHPSVTSFWKVIRIWSQHWTSQHHIDDILRSLAARWDMLRDVERCCSWFLHFQDWWSTPQSGARTPDGAPVLATDANTADEVEAPRGGAQSAKMVRFGDSCMGLTWLYNVIYIYI